MKAWKNAESVLELLEKEAKRWEHQHRYSICVHIAEWHRFVELMQDDRIQEVVQEKVRMHWECRNHIPW